MKKLLGIDYGSKRIGIAVSDDEGKIAFPKTILDNNDKLFENLKKIIESEKISGIVLGESLNFKGEKNQIMKEIEKFKLKIEKKFDLLVYFEQEFMTSMQARNEKKFVLLNSARGGRDLTGQAKKQRIDDSSAAIILQSYLDSPREIQ